MNEELWDQTYAHNSRINQLSERIKALEDAQVAQVLFDLTARIERLETIIIHASLGTESSAPDKGNGHIHWVYPLNGASDLVDEIRVEREAEADLAQEWFEQQCDEEANRCSQCGERYTPIPHMDQGLCEECVSDLAEEQCYLDHADESLADIYNLVEGP